ncbi:MAG TPA: hypothetical protein VFJ16_01990 [Longimicrobium sp.]|nr:hypothetical protein [Longimicrobium sp.]
MRRLSAGEVLDAWEAGRDQHPLDRALTLLAAASPGTPRATLAALSVAERDARLLELRAAMLGPQLPAFTPCPACGERLEMTLDSGELGVRDAPPGPGPWDASVGGMEFRFRLPDSRDLAAVAECASAEEGRRLLAERCVLAARRGGREVAAAELTDDEVSALSEAMGEVAPNAEVVLALSCPACGEAWSALLDVEAFFWAELSVRARRVLREVDALARAYGWSEREILSLPPRRRRSYLELVEG